MLLFTCIVTKIYTSGRLQICARHTKHTLALPLLSDKLFHLVCCCRCVAKKRHTVVTKQTHTTTTNAQHSDRNGERNEEKEEEEMNVESTAIYRFVWLPLAYIYQRMLSITRTKRNYGDPNTNISFRRIQTHRQKDADS